MSGFIRPELRAALAPWREALLGAALVLFGLYWALWGGGLMRWVGGAILLAGVAIALPAVRRARFPGAGNGPGMVDVDERQITWFGPDGGGAISIDAIVRVEFDTRQGRTWVFHTDGAAPLRVPADAAGADKLFDALAPLPGLDYDAAIRAARHVAPSAGGSNVHALVPRANAPKARNADPQDMRGNANPQDVRENAQHLFVIWQRDRARLH
ncbi:hypothetical protein [Oceaniglobus trochenteri]|uniref:hypothetical protein n=1 Tax=Oceaniglobus trochenteri TaxID=2763260 RepID=UPI001CFFA3F0|nr:hypothetical protein [Oceaniglobus trochenteri]